MRGKVGGKTEFPSKPDGRKLQAAVRPQTRAAMKGTVDNEGKVRERRANEGATTAASATSVDSE